MDFSAKIKSGTVISIQFENAELFEKINIQFKSANVCFVRFEDQVITLEMSTSDTVVQVKNKIQGMLGISPNHQHLSFAGKRLEDGRTLEEYNVKKGSLLCLECSMKITVMILGFPSIILEVSGSDTVDELKKQIEKIASILPNKQVRLKFGDKNLENGHTLAEYGIVHMSTVQGICSID